MNILDKYSAIHNYVLNEPPVRPCAQKKVEPVHLLEDIKSITIAEIRPESKGVITAHRLKDYRRKVFSLLLLPDIELPIDEMLADVPELKL